MVKKYELDISEKKFKTLLNKEIKKFDDCGNTSIRELKPIAVVMFDDRNGVTEIVWLREFFGVEAFDCLEDIIGITEHKIRERPYLDDYLPFIEKKKKEKENGRN